MVRDDKKVELLLPAGNMECLRAAVNNGADAVYLGLNRFNARQSSDNFDSKNIASAIKYCHDRDVKVYVTLNTLVKNNEIKQFFELMSIAYSAKADAVIIQDPCFVPIIKKNFSGLKIFMSTQSTITNSYSIPEGVKRVILARELKLEEIKEISSKYETEVFVHGALCFCYSGQCLFSSIAGRRSGNRGMCAQPCRKKYNDKYSMSTMDLCAVEKIPELIEAGVASFKIEGRLRSPYYVATAAKIYRKYIDKYYESKNEFKVDTKDITELKMAFNREFSKGFGFESNIVDSTKPMNRGLYLGEMNKGKIKLVRNVKIGDGVGFWTKEKVFGHKINNIFKNEKSVKAALKGEIVELCSLKDLNSKSNIPVYKTSDSEVKINLGDGIKLTQKELQPKKVTIQRNYPKENEDRVKIFVKVYDSESALKADEAGADIIYYDLFKKDCKEVKKKVRNSKFFVYTPRILSSEKIKETLKLINEVKPDGVLAGNRGILYAVKGYKIHLDYSFNCFNDIDIRFYSEKYNALAVLSPELSFNEIKEFYNKNFAVLVHGDLVLMTTKQQLKGNELVDEEGRRFRVRQRYGKYEILNTKQIGLFNSVKRLFDSGIKYFFIDSEKTPGKFTRIYKMILSGKEFNDKKIRKGYTKGHFERGVY